MLIFKRCIMGLLQGLLMQYTCWGCLQKRIDSKTKSFGMCFLSWKKLLTWSKRKWSAMHWERSLWVFGKGKGFLYGGAVGFHSCPNFQKFSLLSDIFLLLSPPQKSWVSLSFIPPAFHVPPLIMENILGKWYL